MAVSARCFGVEAGQVATTTTAVAGGVPSPALALAALVGLPFALWSWKCMMMYIFQRKLIYMGYIPPGARTQPLSSVHPTRPGQPLSSLVVEQVRVQGEHGVELAALWVQRKDAPASTSPPTVIMYLQGNAGNPLQRLPMFETLLGAWPLARTPTEEPPPAIFALAPRSYWLSTSRTPTQHGILSDYAHALAHIRARYPQARIVLHGHSLGGSIACCLLASLHSPPSPHSPFHLPSCANPIAGLILENAFSSVPDMVRALYASRWLPYHWMAPLVWDRWDALAAIDAAHKHGAGSLLARLGSEILVITSEKDQVVPGWMGDAIWRAATGGKTELVTSKRVKIAGAMHDDAWKKREWNEHIQRYIREVEQQRPLSQVLVRCEGSPRQAASHDDRQLS